MFGGVEGNVDTSVGSTEKGFITKELFLVQVPRFYGSTVLLQFHGITVPYFFFIYRFLVPQFHF